MKKIKNNDDDIGGVGNNKKFKTFNTNRFNLKQHQFKYISTRGQKK